MWIGVACSGARDYWKPPWALSRLLVKQRFPKVLTQWWNSFFGPWVFFAGMWPSIAFQWLLHMTTNISWTLNQAISRRFLSSSSSLHKDLEDLLQDVLRSVGSCQWLHRFASDMSDDDIFQFLKYLRSSQFQSEVIDKSSWHHEFILDIQGDYSVRAVELMPVK